MVSYTLIQRRSGKQGTRSRFETIPGLIRNTDVPFWRGTKEGTRTTLPQSVNGPAYSSDGRGAEPRLASFPANLSIAAKCLSRHKNDQTIRKLEEKHSRNSTYMPT